MKRVLLSFLFLAVLALPWAAKAQSAVGDYAMTTGTDATKWFTLDDNADTIVAVYADDVAYGTFSLGMPFTFCGVEYTDFSVNSNGNFRLGATATTSGSYSTPFGSSSAGANAPKIVGVGRDLGTGSNGYIIYEVMGTAPNRTFVCEFATANTFGSSLTADVKWQIQLCEEGQWRIVYGATPSTLPSDFQLGASTSSSDAVTINPSTHVSSYGATTTTYNVWPGEYRYYEFVAASCARPANLAVSNVTSSSAVVTWSAGGSENEWVGTITPAVNGISSLALTDTAFMLIGLDANTQYTIGIRSVCSATDTSDANGISFTTLCGVEALPYYADYSNFSSCWNRYSGLVDGVLAGTASLTSTSSGWTTNSNVWGESHYKLNIYGTGCKYWMVTPAVDVNANAHLMFDAAFTAYGNGNAPSSFSPDDRFVVLATTDDGATWTTIMHFDTSATADGTINSIPNTGATYTVALPQFLGEQVRFAFYGESTVSGGDNDLHVHNIIVEEVPTCPRPANLTVADVDANSATLNWSVGASESAWQVEYKVASDSVWSAVQGTIGDTTYTLANLNHSTSYDVRLRAYCSADDQSPWISAAFTTSCGVNALPWNEDFNGGFGMCWTRYNSLLSGVMAGTGTLGNPTTSGWSVVTNNNGIQGKHVKVNIFGTSCKYWMVTPALSINGNAILSFDAALTSYASANAPSQTSPDDRLVVLMTTDDSTWTILREWNGDSTNADLFAGIPSSATNYTINVDGLSNATVRFAFYGESTVSGGDNDLHIGNISVVEGVTAPDTITVNATAYEANYYSADNDWYVELVDDDYAFFFDIVADSLISGHTYTLSDMLEDYTYGMNLTDYDYLLFTAVDYTQTTTNNRLNIHAVATASDGNVYVINYSDTLNTTIDTVVVNMPLFVSEYDAAEGFVAAFVNADTTFYAEFFLDTIPADGVLYTTPDVNASYIDFLTYNMGQYSYATYTQSMVGNMFNAQGTALMGHTYYVFNYSEQIIPDSVNIAVFSADTNMGTVIGAGRYEVGQDVTIAAIANTGYHFVTWSDNDSTAARTFVADVDTTFTATFAANMYTVAAVVNDAAMGTVTGSGEYAYGTEATLIATANEGFRFIGWINAGTHSWADVITGDTLTLTVTENVSLIATFSIAVHTVTAVANDAAMGTVTGSGEYAYGTEVTLTATANEGFRFVNWSNGETEATITLTVTEDVTLTANFEVAETGIDNVDLTSVKVYPNPTMGKVAVSADNVTKVEVLDLVGRMVAVVEGSNTIDLSTLSNGVYTLRITTEDGIAVRKVVKK